MKILVLTASTGGGHNAAASALKNTIEHTEPSADVKIVDALKCCGAFYNRLICDGYLILATKAPRLYGRIYRRSDKQSGLNSLCNGINIHEGKKLIPVFERLKPDAVISCHPFITTMLSDLKKDKKLTVPVISLVTDFTPHRTYFFPDIDAYITSNEDMTEKVEKYGIVSRDCIYPLGIPIAEKFYAPAQNEKTAAELGFTMDIPTVLLMAGSFGVTEVLDFYESFMQTGIMCQCIVITGHNHRLYEAFNRYIRDNVVPHKPTRLFEYVNNVEEYMKFSDLIVTKPGGLTVTESLACGLPLAIYNAIPGQEYDNASYLKKAGAAVILDKKPQVGGSQIAELLGSPQKLCEMKKSCLTISKPDSALNIFRLAENIVNKKPNAEI